MEVFLFEPQTYQRLYNCSFYDVDSIPIERRRNPFLGSIILASYFVFFSLYSLVIYAMLRSQFRNQETYRLMIFLGIIHCLGLQACGLATGFFAIQGYVFCSSPTIIYFAGQLALATWCASAMTSLLLGFNRCCELYGGGLSQQLFGGHRIWIWLSIPLIYMMYVFWFTMPVAFSAVQMVWLFDPHADYYPDHAKTYQNKVHSMNNIILCSTESFLYAALIALYWRATRLSTQEIKNAFKREKMIYIQVLCVGIIHFTASSIYVFIQYVHANFAITMIASTFYLLSQGFPSVIYLCVNKTIRNLLLSRLGLRKRETSKIVPSSEPQIATLSSNTRSTSIGMVFINFILLLIFSSFMCSSSTDIINDLPNVQECPTGKRFIVNHILFVCHQFGERRSFRPFACATENDIATAQLIGQNTTYNERFFRYKCERVGHKLTYKPLTCLLSDVHITPGTTIRRGQTEYSCILDNTYYMKLIQRRMLHDFCMPGNQNDTLLENDTCPGISVGATHAKFGSGTEVVYDFQFKTIIDTDVVIRR